VDRLGALDNQAMSVEALSPKGALAQLYMLASDVDAALSFVPEKERMEPVERGIRRAFHSIADVLERLSGERLERLRGYYQSEWCARGSESGRRHSRLRRKRRVTPMVEVPKSVTVRGIYNQLTTAKQVFACAHLAAKSAEDECDARALAVVLEMGVCRLMDIEEDLKRLLGDEVEDDEPEGSQLPQVATISRRTGPLRRAAPLTRSENKGELAFVRSEDIMRSWRSLRV
jgi:hypothetical protein